ncbi:MAG: DUF262 domain-containing protein [Sedimentisphaerales bacterium]
MIRFASKHYCINDFREWDDRGELQLTPKFQRRAVWSDKARSFLMDTVICGYPISKIFMRHDIDPKTKKSIREIVDGQQRIRAILNYLKDGFKISKNHNEEYGGKYYSQLPLKVQKQILQHEISVDVLLGAEDTDVLDIFARLNTYTVKLNKQELINSKYFGLFKQSVYSLGYEYVNFWLKNKVLTEKEVARMGEAEFASELIIIVIDGLQDRKKIEDYYGKFDDVFGKRKYVSDQFKETIDTISEIMGENLSESNFSKKPLFYSLFGVIKELLPSKIQKRDYPKILSALEKVDNILNSDIDDLSKKEYAFHDACTKHVTDLSRREVRHAFIKELILGHLDK